MSTVHFVVPDAADDPARPSGGNHYDRRLAAALGDLGWAVRWHPLPGFWGAVGRDGGWRLGRLLGELPPGALVLLDGLVAAGAPQAVRAQARRLRPVVLVHAAAPEHAVDAQPAAPEHAANAQPAGPEHAADAQRAVLGAAAAVIATSGWSRDDLLRRYPLAPGRVHVAAPGVDPADPAPGTSSGGALLCVAALTPAKGHRELVAALAAVGDRAWHCTCVGDLARDPAFTGRVRDAVAASGLADRVRLAGPLPRAGVDRRYRQADLLILPSHAETYGMVVTEALAHGLPVLASDVGGVPEALGAAPDGSRPGLLVRPGDPAALAGALAAWLDDAALRDRLRRSARDRRATLPGWPATAASVAEVLRAVGATVSAGN